MNLRQIKEKVQKIKIKLPQLDSKIASALKLATATVIPIALAITVITVPHPAESVPNKVVTAMPLKLEKNVFQLETVGKAQIVVGESQAQRKEREAQQQQMVMAKSVQIASVSRPQEEIKAYAFELICSRWDASQWGPFDFIVDRESGWNWQARNRSSGAYGLGQALPASKMGDLANTPEGQVQWVVAYIADRYGSPSSAHQFWATHGWY